MEYYFYSFCKKLCFPVLRKMHKYSYYTIPKQGGVIIVVDPHTSNLDPFLVGAAFHGRVHSWVKAEFLDQDLCQRDLAQVMPKWVALPLSRLIVWAMRGAGTMPIARGRIIRKGLLSKDEAKSINKETFKQSVSLLQAGKMVGIFPAGTRRVDAPWSDSFIALAREACVPLRLVTLRRRKTWLPFARYEIIVGKKLCVTKETTVSDIREEIKKL